MSAPSSPIRRVLQVHTRYRELGGEDRVVDNERDLLAGADIAVRQIIFDNADLQEGRGVLGDIRLAASAVWSGTAARRVRMEIGAFRPDVIHVHNTFAAASPSIYTAARRAGVPVVQTLHNYRMVCPKATVFRDGHVCTDCVGQPIPIPAIVHACVRDSRTQSAAATALMTVHRARGTYRREVNAFVALTRFQRDLLVRGGLPRSRIRVIPNFLEPDPGPGQGPRSGFLYVGRLSEEKGITTLIDAAAAVPGAVRIAGDGPLAPEVRAAAERGTLEYLGRLDSQTVTSEIGRAVAIVVPSTWYEGLPMVLIESFAKGTPVIASRIGSLAELIEDGKTGMLMEPGRAADLAATMHVLIDSKDDARRMGLAARSDYERSYRGQVHLEGLLDVYSSVRGIGRAESQ